MAKILISALGTGGKFETNQVKTSDRSYQKATYCIDQKSYPNSRFVSSVLYKHLNLDGIVFIGTVKSMWEAVYDFFCQEKEVEKDFDYWFELATTIDSCNCHSALDVLDLSKLRELLGENSHCILIKYGINEQELWENIDRVIEVVNSFKKGDEIYIDITHSFRSLAVLQFLSISFIKDLLTDRNIKIKGIYYGMFEAARPEDLGYTPIINLMPFFELISWMQGAYSLKAFGNGYLIAELLKQQGEKDMAAQISRLTEAININYVTTIRQRASDVKTSLQHRTFSGPFNYIKHIPENFAKQFALSNSTLESDFQLEFAGWNFKNKRYATGYIVLAEAIITYVCEINDQDINNYEVRETMKKIFNRSENRNKQLAILYKQINPIRNTIAHASFERRTSSYSSAIEKATEYYQKVKIIFKTKTLGS